MAVAVAVAGRQLKKLFLWCVYIWALRYGYGVPVYGNAVSSDQPALMLLKYHKPVPKSPRESGFFKEEPGIVGVNYKWEKKCDETSIQNQQRPDFKAGLSWAGLGWWKNSTVRGFYRAFKILAFIVEQWMH